MSKDNPESVIPGPYWGPFPGESQELYERLGVPHFYKKVVRPYYPKYFIGDFSIKYGVDINGKTKREELEHSEDAEVPTREESLERYVDWTKRNEKIHVWGFLGFLAYNMYFLKTGDMQNPIERLYTFGVAASNVTFNVYPIMLQRHNRLKAYNALSDLTD